MHSIHPTMHELAGVTTPRPAEGRDHAAHPARTSLRTRRDHILVSVGAATVRLGLRLGAAGGRPVAHRSGAPPDPRLVA